VGKKNLDYLDPIPVHSEMQGCSAIGIPSVYLNTIGQYAFDVFNVAFTCCYMKPRVHCVVGEMNVAFWLSDRPKRF
jgi:hypothetical protein